MKLNPFNIFSPWKDPDLRKGIIASVVASILFVIFIQPILKFSWSVLSHLSEIFYSGYLNSVYTNAALGERNYLDVIFFSLLLFPLTYPMMSVLSEIRHRKYLLQHSGETEEAKAERLAKRRRVLETLIIGSTALSLMGYLFFLTATFADLQLNTSFQQRLTVLGPFLSSQDEKEFRGAWALMESRDDYLKINARMDSLAIKHNIRLPQPLIR